jgi:ClpP class serine protease
VGNKSKPFEPLGDEARAAWQADVNSYGDMFTADVARNRGVGLYSVKNGFGEGRMVMAPDSVAGRMADRVATFDQTLSGLTKGSVAGQTEKAFSAELARRKRELELVM